MKMLRLLGASAMSVLLLAGLAFGQITPPEAKLRVFGVSPNLVSKQIPGIDKASNGLSNVGKGSKTYFICGGKTSSSTTAGSGQYFKSATYAIIQAPTGSTAQIVTIDSIRASFTPDVVGVYKISMVGTDDLNRTDGDTATLHAGMYLGFEGTPSCGMCHAAIANKWKETGHAKDLPLRLNETPNHFASYCLPCHSTGSPDPASESGGFLDLAKKLNWQFPTQLGPGTWEALKTNYPTLAAMGSVQCESCHGPGSEHIGNTADQRITKRMTGDQCLQCHDALPYHTMVQDWQSSPHSRSYDEPASPEYINRGSKTAKYSDCARCHTSNGFIDTRIKGKAYSDAPYKDVGAVSCVTCHDPHSADNEAQLRLPKKEACQDCHTLRLSSRSGLHNSHQGDMIRGISGVEFPGYTYVKAGGHTSTEDRCVDCHMAEPDTTYKGKLGGHTFSVLWNNGTPDNHDDDVVNENACKSCHPVTTAAMHASQQKFKDQLEELRKLLPQHTDGTPLYPYGSDTTKMTSSQIAASFNYYFVLNDKSFGMHNKNYSKSLLDASIAVMKATAVEKLDGAIASFELGQNYPNPFNPTTTITFSVPEAGAVTLVIYDQTGREVNRLVNGFYQAGAYRVAWNGGDTSQNLVPSGVYYYRLITGQHVATRKMVFVK